MVEDGFLTVTLPRIPLDEELHLIDIVLRATKPESASLLYPPLFRGGGGK